MIDSGKRKKVRGVGFLQILKLSGCSSLESPVLFGLPTSSLRLKAGSEVDEFGKGMDGWYVFRGGGVIGGLEGMSRRWNFVRRKKKEGGKEDTRVFCLA